VKGSVEPSKSLGVAVCWTGQAKMAIIMILGDGKDSQKSEKTEKIDPSDFSELNWPGFQSECTNLRESRG
jgi:hypothetical protein